ncbi:apoptosis regulatory protein Siva isoform X2 [Girardinichthys multiradiatus]|uniref:apoptosis regulatory protein Siva isoform X2 n=1 Tax=Girardinichthys multiradiatus TaxID=208333 RepID=UPI001FAB376F|nr:apoptosis regulatory protein Siva isoform X2 [Girardinichthys multiradiatus]
MPKRTCPFPEAFSTQYKIHIGQREINNYGVFGNKYRQEIYGVPAVPTGCCVCHKNQGSRTPCSQCDRLACASCTRQCSSCCSLCCSVCSIIDYSGPYDEVLCCSCST